MSQKPALKMMLSDDGELPFDLPGVGGFQPTLGRAFGFSQHDLEANRAGRFSVDQLNQLAKSEIRTYRFRIWGQLFIAWLIGIVAMTTAIISIQIPDLWIAPLLLMPFGIVTVMIVILKPPKVRYHPSLHQVTGTLQKIPLQYRVFIGMATLDVSYEQYVALTEGYTYTIYYASPLTRILSIEVGYEEETTN